jgi:hypothetical protein
MTLVSLNDESTMEFEFVDKDKDNEMWMEAVVIRPGRMFRERRASGRLKIKEGGVG